MLVIGGRGKEEDLGEVKKGRLESRSEGHENVLLRRALS